MAAAALIAGGLLQWARAPQHPERRLILGAAAVLTGLVVAVYVLALSVGWWTGAYFALSPVVQAAIVVPLSLLGLTVWLAGYHWLGDHSNQPVQIYFAISVLLVLGVAIAHRFNLGQGTILVGPGSAVVVQAAVAQIILWIPVLVYEGLRRNVERFEPLP
jgi:hypothetical protein